MVNPHGSELEVLWADSVAEACDDDAGHMETEMMSLKSVHLGPNVGDEVEDDDKIYTLLALLVRGVRVGITPMEKKKQSLPQRRRNKKQRCAWEKKTKAVGKKQSHRKKKQRLLQRQRNKKQSLPQRRRNKKQSLLQRPASVVWLRRVILIIAMQNPFLRQLHGNRYGTQTPFARK